MARSKTNRSEAVLYSESLFINQVGISIFPNYSQTG